MAINRRFQGANGESREEVCFVDVTVWGVDFAGHAEFEIGPCTVPIDFGSPRKIAGETLGWGPFVAKYLEDAGGGAARALSAITGKGSLPTSTSDPKGAPTADGSPGLPYQVFAEFELTVTTTVPATGFDVAGVQPSIAPRLSSGANTGLGLAPMGAANVGSTVRISLEVKDIHAFVTRAIKEMAPGTIDSGIVRWHPPVIEGLPGMSEQFAEWMGAGTTTADRTWMAWYFNSSAERLSIDTPRDRGLPLFRPGGGLPGETLLVHPLRFRNRLQGALVAVGERGAFSPHVDRVLTLVANQAAAAIDLIELLETNMRLALHDGLTGLLNRRAFDEALERSVAQATRAGQPLSLLMIDLDHFKRLNDTYGHAIGDAALQAAAAEIRHQVRAGDLGARYGGEEFAVILPDTDGPAAFRMAERLRKALAERVVKAGDEQLRMTASCGVSATDLGYGTPETLIHSADEALYASKETGRNRTSLAGTPRR